MSTTSEVCCHTTSRMKKSKFVVSKSAPFEIKSQRSYCPLILTFRCLKQRTFYLLKAKFPYASWFEVGSNQVRNWFEAASVMEFGFN